MREFLSTVPMLEGSGGGPSGAPTTPLVDGSSSSSHVTDAERMVWVAGGATRGGGAATGAQARGEGIDFRTVAPECHSVEPLGASKDVADGSSLGATPRFSD